MSSAPAMILVVDDNQLNRELVSDVLEAAGYTVLQADSAEVGLETVRSVQPDLILMDIGLPGMDGYEALRRLKAQPATRAIPVIALTAFAMTGDEAQALRAGFDGYLTKPIQTRTLAATVQRWLPERSQTS